MSGFELSVKSGKALVYFFSDLAFNMYGFNITFAYDKCPGSCSSNGECRHGVCHCYDGYRGTACDRLICRQNDTGQPGAEACSYAGVPTTEAVFDSVLAEGEMGARASHASVVVNESSIW
uniref:EGF-like domain-containing protein n=1 Tax=Parascaris equorum TaxID=6256 RepID=A0A914RMV8_PAREQ